ncbi:EAL domain-containing protein [Pseudovibrio sp. SPO723]|uniref:EAL domain-containing protein n=1 Tax=Nesiotobacter zosterae TaxID=392721 RepID=UPI0029C42062|nr:EAL domain-containing protein [Pseudovibrio sp. SPO723]MDX5593990.1 EAL domain-containing protein [Pseudovibrio sp. SPO723]
MFELASTFPSASEYAGVVAPAFSTLVSLEQLWPMATAAMALMTPLGFFFIFGASSAGRDLNVVITRAIAVFAVGVACFTTIGFMIAFGPTKSGWFGFDPSLMFMHSISDRALAAQAFQTVLCGIVVLFTYIPLARMLTFKGHLITAAVLAIIVYPVYAHWVWGIPATSLGQGALSSIGFIDHSGITVIHMTAPLFALAAQIATGRAKIGPARAYGFEVDWERNAVPILAGILLIIIGWAGLNIGSVKLFSGLVPMIVYNTLNAALFGALTGALLGRFRRDLPFLANILLGIMGGLTFSSAAPELITSAAATLTGILGAACFFLIFYYANKVYGFNRLAASHMAYAGVAALGSVAISVIIPSFTLEAITRDAQLGAQILGVLTNAAWVLGTGFILFTTLDRFGMVKLGLQKDDGSAEEDNRGELAIIEQTLEEVLHGDMDNVRQLEIPHGDIHARITSQVNELVERFQTAEDRRAFSSSKDTESADFQKLKVFADGTFEGLVISKNGRIIECNKAFQELIGRPEDELISKPILNFVAPDHIKITERALKNTHQAPYQTMIISKLEERIPVEIRARPLELNGIVFRLSAIRDIRQQKKAEAEILHLAQHDILTGLPNRTLFRERFQTAVENHGAKKGLVAIMMIDLDRFKEINDLYGHPTGDKFIQTVSKRLNACIGHADTCARLGGDEFAIIQVNLKTKAEVGLLANRILEMLSKPVSVTEDITIRTSASIGIALSPDNGLDPDMLLANADIALYKAKEEGRNTFRFFESEMESALRIRRVLEVDMRKAIRNQEFQLYFQPQARASDRSIVGYEALLRWNHPTKGFVSPTDFIPVAEESGLIIPIGRWVLEEACRNAASWPSKYRVGVNLSAVQFADEYLLQHVEQSLKKSGLAPQRLELEVTESVLLHDDRRALETLKALKARGVRIALDDFGTGYSSLSYLRRFPFDRLKIDRSFVSGATATPGLAAIIRAVIDLGQALGMEVIAEGVETEPELELLRNEACDEVQGYLIGRPAPLSPEDLLAGIHERDGGQLNEYIVVLNEVSKRLEENRPEANNRGKEGKKLASTG